MVSLELTVGGIRMFAIDKEKGVNNEDVVRPEIVMICWVGDWE